MIHVNTWHGATIVAAYAAADDDVPTGVPVGRNGNAVLLRDGDFEHVISRPRIAGDILNVVPAAVGAPEMDLSRYF